MSSPVRDTENSDNKRISETANQLVRSSFLLAAGNLIETAVLALASLIIARLLGPSGFGIFSLVLTVPIFLSLFADFGAIYSIQRNAAYYVSRGELATARRMTRNAILFILTAGLALTVFCFYGATFFCSMVLHRPELAPYLRLSSILIVSQSLFTAISLAFLGWGSAGFSSALNVSQAIFKLVLAPLLIVLGFGVLGAIEGHVFSYVIGAVVGFVAIYALKLREREKSGVVQVSDLPNSSSSALKVLPSPSVDKLDYSFKTNFKVLVTWRATFSLFGSDINKMIRYGLPAFLATGIAQFAGVTFVLFVLAAYLSNDVIGYYQAAYNLAQGVVLVSSAIGYSMFSTFSTLDGLRADVRAAFRHSVTYVSLVLTPVILFSIGASNALIVTFYGQSYVQASSLFSFLLLAYLPNALGLTVFTSYFNGIGKTRFTLYIWLAYACVIFVTAPLLEVYGFGVFGVIYSLIIASLICSLLGAYLASHYADSRIDLRAGARIFVASDFCFIAIYLLQTFFHLPHVGTLILDFVLFFGMYLTLLPILRVITAEDFERLRGATSSLGMLQRLFDIIIRYELYLMRRFSSRSSGTT